MPRYEVSCSVGGSLVFHVEAADADEAEQKVVDEEDDVKQVRDETDLTGFLEVKELDEIETERPDCGCEYWAPAEPGVYGDGCPSCKDELDD